MTDAAKSTLELVNTIIDARAEQGAAAWREEVAKLVDEAVEEWYEEVDGIDRDLWENLYKPALLWRFHTHLSFQLRDLGAGWEEIFFQKLKEHDAL